MNDWIEMGMLLLIPAVMIVIGAVFLKRPPKRVNGFYGYRTARSMSSQEAWDFAHRVCGRLWLGCGIAVGDHGVIKSYKDNGLVPEVFSRDVLDSLGDGHIAVGHAANRDSHHIHSFNPLMISKFNVTHHIEK